MPRLASDFLLDGFNLDSPPENEMNLPNEFNKMLSRTKPTAYALPIGIGQTRRQETFKALVRRGFGAALEKVSGFPACWWFCRFQVTRFVSIEAPINNLRADV